MKKLYALFAFFCLWLAAGVACQVEGETHNVGSTYPTPTGDAGIPVIYNSRYAASALAGDPTNDVLKWEDGGPSWGTGSSIFTAGGDLSGTATSQTVTHVQGQPVAAVGTISRGSVDYYGASGWTPLAAPSGAGTTDVLSFNGTDPTWKLAATLPANLAIATIASQATGDILAYSSGAWNRVAGGTNGYALTTVSTAGPPVWAPVVDPSMNGFRLTLTTVVPVTTSNVTGAGTIYLSPWRSGYISLYTASAWVPLVSSEVSFAVSCTTGDIKDLLAYSNAGVLTITQTAAWASATTRTDALAQQDGTWVLSSDHSKRWVGTYKCSNTNQTEDSTSHRYLWNVANQVPRQLSVIDTTDTWSYTTGSFRQTRAQTANRYETVCGDVCWLHANALSIVTSTNQNYSFSGVGIDSTTVNSATTMGGTGAVSNSGLTQTHATYEGYLAAGYHAINWLEYGGSGGLFIGDNGGPVQSGMTGWIMAWNDASNDNGINEEKRTA